MPSSRRIAAGIASLLLVGVGTYSFVAQWWGATAHPPTADWRRAAEYVADNLEEDDVVRVHPAWTQTPLPALESAGRSVHRQEYPVREDFVGVDRIWILSDANLRDEAVARVPFDVAGTHRRDVGGVSVLTVDIPRDELPRVSLLERLPGANIRIDGPDGRHSCGDFDERNWRVRCHGPGARSFVGRDLQFFADDAHQCIRARPPSGDRRLVLEFPSVPQGAMLRLRAGIDTHAALAKNGSDVQMTVRSEGLPTLEQSFDRDRASWHAYDIALPETGETSLTIEVSAADTHKRFFCLNGWVYDPAVAPVEEAWQTRRHR